MTQILAVKGREILDSRGNPTVEVDVYVQGGIVGRACVPSGASTGTREAVELRDGGKRHRGKGVRRAVANVDEILGPRIVGKNALDQRTVDAELAALDRSEGRNKSQLGANAILGVSLAVAKAGALAAGLPLYRYLGGAGARTLPVPMLNVLNGGAHADNNVDVQEFMLLPAGASSFAEGMRMACEIYHQLAEVLRKRKLATAVGDEGGFAPDLGGAEEALDLLRESIARAEYEPGRDVQLTLDVAASELWDDREKIYRLEGAGLTFDRSGMVDYLEGLCDAYPEIVSIEDGMAEQDWEGWRTLTERLGPRVRLVADDLFVTNPAIIRKGIAAGVANGVLVKVNQIGTLSETFDAIDLAASAGYSVVISHRSGETEDTFIADLAVATGVGWIKTGAPCRSERTAKYNQLLRIEEELGARAAYGRR